MKNYLLICEIGPIFDFTSQSRKTVDFWGASFLFSYLMAEVGRVICQKDGRIFLPYLDDNPMFLEDGEVTCGSVPDQIYAVFEKSKKEAIEKALEDIIVTTMKEKIIPHFSATAGVSFSDTNKSEIQKFINFFYIVNEIRGDTPTYNEFIEAERKIRMRAAFRPFEQATSSSGINKWEKCNLCGDRQKVFQIDIEKDAKDLLDTERICSVCLLKRYLPKIAEKLNPNIKAPSGEDHYQSTSDIAAIPIRERMKLFESFIPECLKKLDEKDRILREECKAGPDEGQGRGYFDMSLNALKDFRETFKQCEDRLKENGGDYMPFAWLNRPFYSIVYMDGDNMGEVLKKNADNFEPYIKKASELLSKFSSSVNKIITDYCGQLIFAGGEDINFVIHPEYLLDCVEKLNESYNRLFAEDDLTKPMAEKFTLSTGAIVCYHKYPLSEAIRRAGAMLKEHAKQHKGKNATAISLIKGHTETLNLTFSNSLIDKLKAMKECLIKADISRTTPYRIEEHKELFSLIADETLRKNFLYTIIAGTRNPHRENKEIEELVELLTSFGHTATMINALLFARFLSGEK